MIDNLIQDIENSLSNPHSQSRQMLEMVLDFLKKSKLDGYEFVKTKPSDFLWLDEWLELFPEGVKNAGKKIRQDKELCERKMKVFVRKYGYTPDIIMKATKDYLEERALNGYAYTMLSGNFINHREKGSLLAEKCEEIVKENKKVQFEPVGDLI